MEKAATRCVTEEGLDESVCEVSVSFVSADEIHADQLFYASTQHRMVVDQQDGCRFLISHGEGGAEAHTFIASSAREMSNKAENEASGVVSTALTNLALYRDPVVALNTSHCDFRIHVHAL